MRRWLGIGVAVLGTVAAVMVGLLVAPPVFGQLIGESRPRVEVTTAQATPESLTAYDVVSIASTLRSEHGTFRDLTVDMDVRNTEGGIILRATQRGIRLTEGDERTLYWFWRVPGHVAPGDYTVNFTVYGPNWSPLYTSRESAAALEIVRVADAR